jgi:hypothetical protein
VEKNGIEAKLKRIVASSGKGEEKDSFKYCFFFLEKS